MLDKSFGVLESKMSDYASPESDCLQNFRQLSTLLGVPMRQVWFVYFMKHVLSVANWSRHGKLESEPLDDRLGDIINYCLLGSAIAQEEQDQ